MLGCSPAAPPLNWAHLSPPHGVLHMAGPLQPSPELGVASSGIFYAAVPQLLHPGTGCLSAPPPKAVICGWSSVTYPRAGCNSAPPPPPPPTRVLLYLALSLCCTPELGASQGAPKSCYVGLLPSCSTPELGASLPPAQLCSTPPPPQSWALCRGRGGLFLPPGAVVGTPDLPQARGVREVLRTLAQKVAELEKQQSTILATPLPEDGEQRLGATGMGLKGNGRDWDGVAGGCAVLGQGGRRNWREDWDGAVWGLEGGLQGTGVPGGRGRDWGL